MATWTLSSGSTSSGSEQNVLCIAFLVHPQAASLKSSWLVENGDQPNDGSHDLDQAAASGNLELLVWLHENTTATCSTTATDRAARHNYFHAIKWLHENRTEGCTTDAMDSAVENGRLQVIKWLHANRREGCTTNAINHASSVEIVEWLHANRSEGCTIRAGVNALDQQFQAMFECLVETYLESMHLDEIDDEGACVTYVPPSLAANNAKRQRTS